MPTSAVSARAAPVRGRGILRRRILPEAKGPHEAGPSKRDAVVGSADDRDVERAVAADVTGVERLHEHVARVVLARWADGALGGAAARAGAHGAATARVASRHGRRREDQLRVDGAAEVEDV